MKHELNQGNSISYNIACASSEDLDQPAQMCSLCRVLYGYHRIQNVFELIAKPLIRFGGCAGCSVSSLAHMQS